MENSRIIKKTGIYFIGNLASKIMSSLLLPIYAIYVTAEQLGDYDIVVTVSSIAMPICFCCMWEAVLRFALKETEKEGLTKYCSTVIFFSTLASILVIIISVLGKSFSLFNYSYYSYTCIYVILSGVVQILQAVSRALRRNTVYMLSGVVSTLVQFSMIVLLVCFFSTGTDGLIIGSIFGQIAAVFVLVIATRLWKYLNIKAIDYKLLGSLLVFSAPLILNSVAAWMMTGFSKLVINVHIGATANGLYSFASKFSSLITTLGSVVAMALFEEAVLASDDKNFGHSYGHTITMLNCAFLGMSVLAFPMIIVFYKIFAGSEYMPSKYFVPILLIYALLMNFSTNLGSVFQVIKKTKYQFITTILAAIGSCGCSYIFVMKWNIMGVIIGQLIGAIIMVTSRFLFIKKYLDININFMKQFIQLAFFIIVAVVCVNASVTINIVVFGIALCIEIYLFKEQILVVINKFRKNE